MKLITFDIEEWYIEKKFHGARREKYKQFDEMLDNILALLDSNNTKATFFCLGKIAQEFPHVVKKISGAKHEIGCHSNEHGWLTKMTPEVLRQDTTEAIKSLEDVSGQKVISYRAPAFSITEQNKWALEILAECGIKNDASIFPSGRDFGGYPTFQTKTPTTVSINGVTINEFPIPICKLPIICKNMAYSGGGYFRLLPYTFISQQIKHNDYAMCYFHIADLINESKKMMSRQEYETYFKENGSLKNRLSRYIKSNIGSSNAFAKLERLVLSTEFTSIEQQKKKFDTGKVITI